MAKRIRTDKYIIGADPAMGKDQSAIIVVRNPMYKFDINRPDLKV